MSADMLLSVEALTVAYGSAKVLHDVSMEVGAGERVFLVGRNGAGKTTLLKTIAGLLSPLSGAIRLEGREVGGTPPDQMARDGVRYVFQDKRVFTKLTVRENVEIAAFAAGVALAQAIEDVTRVFPALPRCLDSMAGGLSGGQRQLLLIGRALLGRPRLLLVDEPTEGLSAAAIDEVSVALEAARGKVATVIVEQNLALVRRLATRIYVVKEGRIPLTLLGGEALGDQELEQAL